jgi:hypothetical protein
VGQESLSSVPHPDWFQTLHSTKWVLGVEGFSFGKKLLDQEADHLPSFNAQVEKQWLSVSSTSRCTI